MNYKEQRLLKLKKQYGEPETLEQLFDIIRASIESKGRGNPFVVGLAWSVSHRMKVSNTHCCPADGVTNWSSKPELPKGYPGFTGRVWIRLNERPRDGWISDLFADTLTYPGTGGGGAYDGPWQQVSAMRFREYGHKHHKDFYPEIACFSWDFRFFDADYPKIVEQWTKHNLFNVVATGDAKIDINEYRLWEDEVTKHADQRFMETLKEKV